MMARQRAQRGRRNIRQAQRGRPNIRQAQRGIGVMAVLVVLVVLAALAAAVLRLGRQMHTSTQQDVQGLMAQSAARAGIEFGLYQALKGPWGACAGSSQTLDLSADLGMRVTVLCSSVVYNEGESVPGTPRTLRVFTIDAVACNASPSCPDAGAALREGYVERRRQVQATD